MPQHETNPDFSIKGVCRDFKYCHYFNHQHFTCKLYNGCFHTECPAKPERDRLEAEESKRVKKKSK